MLLFEDRYVKLLGSALALSLVLISIIMAVSAALMPTNTLNMARSIDEGRAKTDAVDQDANIVPVMPQGRPAAQNEQSQVQQSEVRARSAEAGSGNTLRDNADGKATTTSPRSQPSGLSEGDIWLMAQLIHAEGRGEPLEGQVAIGAVLLNRVGDKRFPNSLAGVIYQQGAFCTVRDGQINLSPDGNALKAARLAAAGWDPTGGALYFYNPARSTSRWIYSRPVITRIGRHVFAA
ncbi:MAG: hypothetical protein GX998_08555 [Firmicutes bacterium]|nr:hypothetical protein [Bacillota bacterium]